MLKSPVIPCMKRCQNIVVAAVDYLVRRFTGLVERVVWVTKMDFIMLHSCIDTLLHSCLCCHIFFLVKKFH